MNRILAILLLWGSALTSQTTCGQTPYRFEVETGGSALGLPAPYRTGWHVRQQLTAYVRPRLGAAFGIGWGGSANNAPLYTQDPREPSPSLNPDPLALLNYYNRQERMADLSIVWLPVLTRRHQLKLQVGLSAQRRREINIDSIFREFPRRPNYDALATFTDQRRVVPMVAAGYDFRLSNRWAVGMNGVAYLTGADRPMTTLGLRTTYRFNLPGDSLGIGRVSRQDVRAGVRVAGNVVSLNGMGPGGRYRARFVGGIWAEMPLSLTWAVRGEINYAQRGYRSEEVRQGNVRYLPAFGNANYLELPLLFRHEVAYRWHLYGGPYLAFFLNGYTESDGKRNEPVRPHTVSGLMLGATYALTDRLSLDLRYQRDLVTLSSTPYGGFHSFQAGLNWSFRKTN